MKKAKFLSLIKKIIEQKVFVYLEKKKENHSKVNKINHYGIQMEKYLKPNSEKMTREEIKLIFKMWCKVTETKNNFKGLHDTYECDACDNENETQEHIIQCKVLNILNIENTEKELPKYEKLLNGKVHEQIQIARIFKQNMDIKDQIAKGWMN